MSAEALLAVPVAFLMCVLLRSLIRQHRDGWRHWRKIPHLHADCSICAHWARAGIDVQNNGRPFSREAL